MPKITDLDSVISLDGNDVLPIVSKNNNNEDETMKIAVNAIGTKLLNSNEYGALNTTDKKIIGAINEVNTKASQFDNMTATASGSIATFDNGGDDIPVSEFECEIVATGGGGTPDSPIAINGFSQADIFVNNHSTVVETLTQEYVSASGVITAALPTVPYKCVIARVVQGNTYTYSVNGVATTIPVIAFFDKYPSLGIQSYNSSRSLDESATFTAPITGFVFIRGNSSFDETNQMVATGTNTEYETPNLYTVAFGQTIYGGRLIYANGEWAIEALYSLVSLTGSETGASYAWNSYTFANTLYNGENDGIYTLMCSHTNNHITAIQMYDTRATSDYPNAVCLGAYNTLRFRNSDCTSLADYQTWLQAQVTNGTPVQIIAKLATPVIIPITSSTRVKTISGDNNIYSSTGDCELKYFTNKADSLAELIKAFVV